MKKVKVLQFARRDLSFSVTQFYRKDSLYIAIQLKLTDSTVSTVNNETDKEIWHFIKSVNKKRQEIEFD